jgi:hypothetical protein
MIINMPAANARQAISTPCPEKPKFRRGNRPVIISQIPNNRNPIFFVNFMCASRMNKMFEKNIHLTSVIVPGIGV